MDNIHIAKRLEQLTNGNEIHDAEVRMAEAKYQYEYLEDMKKVVLAKMKDEFTGSNPERETKALGSKEYSIHLEGIREAGLDYGRKLAMFNSKKNEFESLRTLKGLMI